MRKGRGRGAERARKKRGKMKNMHNCFKTRTETIRHKFQCLSFSARMGCGRDAERMRQVEKWFIISAYVFSRKLSEPRGLLRAPGALSAYLPRSFRVFFRAEGIWEFYWKRNLSLLRTLPKPFFNVFVSFLTFPRPFRALSASFPRGNKLKIFKTCRYYTHSTPRNLQNSKITFLSSYLSVIKD